VRLYRIADERFGPESGEGARLYGGRWNSPGRAVIYACTTYAGAMLEKLVHTGRRIPKHQVCVTFEAPDALQVTTLSLGKLTDWDTADFLVSRRAGDAWLQSQESPILLVPSVVFEIERNALINSAHPEATRIRVVSIEPVRWDDRLFSSKP
jgi:RES domain-containing protein